MSETQTSIEKIEEKTRKKFEKTRESINNILEKMRNKNLRGEETEPIPEE